MKKCSRFGVSAATLTVFFVTFLWAWPAVAQPESGNWARVETAHFTILSQSGGEVGRQVGADLERLHHALQVLAPSSHRESPLPSYFYVFSDEASLAPFRQPGSGYGSLNDPSMEVLGGAPSNAGYLVPHEHGNYAVVVGGEDFVPTRYVYKQYIHHRLHEEHPYLPHWFRQGVAEFYSAFKTEGDYALLGLPSEEHLQWIRYRNQPLVPAVQLMTVDEQSFDQIPQMVRQTYFRQSWGLFHFLHNRSLENGSPSKRQQIPQFVAKVAAGMPTTHSFEEAFGLKLDTLNAQLEEYFGRGELTYLKIPVEQLDLLILKSVELKPHEVLYHLGDLSARAVQGGESQAAKFFERSLEMEPSYGPALAGLGVLAESAGNDQAAREHYHKAMAQGSGDFLTSYLYGKSLLRTLEGKRPADEAQEQALEQAIASLRKSVEQSDAFAEAWAELGYAYGLQTEPSDAGVEALQRALGFFPERADLGLNLLLTHARRGERTEADTVFESLKTAGVDAGTLGRAQEILLQMDYREAAQRVRKGRADDAIALFARIQSTTQDPGLKEKAEEQLDKLSMVGDYRGFIDLYNRAAAAVNSGDSAKARELVDRLSEKAVQPWQLGQVKKLRRALAEADKGSEG